MRYLRFALATAICLTMLTLSPAEAATDGELSVGKTVLSKTYGTSDSPLLLPVGKEFSPEWRISNLSPPGSARFYVTQASDVAHPSLDCQSAAVSPDGWVNPGSTVFCRATEAGVAQLGLHNYPFSVSVEEEGFEGVRRSFSASENFWVKGVSGDITMTQQVTGKFSSTAAQKDTVLTHTATVALAADATVPMTVSFVKHDKGTTATNDDYNLTYKSGDTNQNGLLDVGESFVYQGTYSAGTLGKRTLRLSAEAYGFAGGYQFTTTATSSTSVNVFENASNFTKTTEGTELVQGVLTTGTPLKWVYTFENSSQNPYVNVSVADNREGNPTLTGGDISNPGIMDPGETWKWEISGVAQAGGYSNNATITHNIVSDGATITKDTVPATPAVFTKTATSSYVGGTSTSILFKKTVFIPEGEFDADDPVDPPETFVGSPVVWRFSITNTGDLALTAPEITDPTVGIPTYLSGDTNEDGNLSPSETWKYEKTGGEATEGINTNTARAQVSLFTDGITETGLDNAVQLIEAQDSASYRGIVAQPGVTIEFTTDGQDSDTTPGATLNVGDSVSWVYSIMNTGNVPLTEVSVTDTGTAAIVCPSTELAVNETMDCTASGLVQVGQYSSTATVTGIHGETVVSASDSSNYFGSVPVVDVPTTEIVYKNCEEALAAGKTNIKKGEPGYSTNLDRDGDGIACESDTGSSGTTTTTTQGSSTPSETLPKTGVSTTAALIFGTGMLGFSISMLINERKKLRNLTSV